MNNKTYDEKCCLFVRKNPVYNDTKDLSNKVHVKYNTRTKQWLKATHDLSDTTILFIVVDPSFERNTPYSNYQRLIKFNPYHAQI